MDYYTTTKANKITEYEEIIKIYCYMKEQNVKM